MLQPHRNCTFPSNTAPPTPSPPTGQTVKLLQEDETGDHKFKAKQTTWLDLDLFPTTPNHSNVSEPCSVPSPLFLSVFPSIFLLWLLVSLLLLETEFCYVAYSGFELTVISCLHREYRCVVPYLGRMFVYLF